MKPDQNRSSPKKTLGDYFALQRGTTYKSRLLGLPGPVLLGLATIARNGGFRSDNLRTYGGESPDKLLVRPGDLYVSLKDVTQSGDLLGAVARLPKDHEPGRLTQDTVKLEPLNDGVPLEYLYWLMRTPQCRSYCRSHATGTTNLGLAREDFLAFSVPEPSEDRCTIATTLSTLDDKIDLNRRTSETLEAMARALFKSWFVDFDPVHAKARGQAPAGMDAETAALFPSKLEDSELGPIPKGWGRAPLAEWVDALSGGTPAKSNPAYWNGTIPWISPKVMTSIHANEAEHFVTEAAIGNGTRLAPTGATLVMVRGMGLHQEVRVSQTLREVTFNQDVKALVGKDIEPTLLLYALLHAQQSLLMRVESSGHGTGRLPSEVLLSYPITMPKRATQQRIARPIADINQRIVTLGEESRTLAELRDALLPWLLSGQLPAPRIDEPIKESTR